MKVSDIEVSLVDCMGTDLSVVNAARVSFDKESNWDDSWIKEYVAGSRDDIPDKNVLKQSDAKLIAYLAKHKHYSPFNHTFITVRVKAPIYVARQLVKHEYMPWNEVSRRYVDSEPEFYFPELRARAENVKQGSATHGLGEQEDNGKMLLFMATEAALNFYNDMKAIGVCPEQARAVLPHNLMTEWIWSGTLKAFHKMLSLRLDPHTQAETRIVAEKCHDLILPLFPVSLPALMENT